MIIFQYHGYRICWLHVHWNTFSSRSSSSSLHHASTNLIALRVRSIELNSQQGIEQVESSHFFNFFFSIERVIIGYKNRAPGRVRTLFLSSLHFQQLLAFAPIHQSLHDRCQSMFEISLNLALQLLLLYPTEIATHRMDEKLIKITRFLSSSSC